MNTIINILYNISLEAVYLFMEMAPYLLLGFLFAGIIKVFVKSDFVYKLLGKNPHTSVFIASIIGIPVPICSCGIIPLATTLYKQGSSKGATLSFITSTPDSGVDSLLATYSLMGLPFTIIRTVATTILAVITGTLTNLFDKDKKHHSNREKKLNCNICLNQKPHTHSLKEKLIAIFKFGFHTLLKDIGVWLLLGIVIGGLIIYFIPQNFIENYFNNTTLSYLSILLLSIPLYVCATGSIPIALALLLKGFSPGSALIFLIVGPATNTATITVIYKLMGKRTTIVFLISIILGSLLLGFTFDTTLSQINLNITSPLTEHAQGISTVKIVSSIILALLLINAYFIYPQFNKRKKECTCS
jgi:hypothetical protein